MDSITEREINPYTKGCVSWVLYEMALSREMGARYTMPGQLLTPRIPLPEDLWKDLAEFLLDHESDIANEINDYSHLSRVFEHINGRAAHGRHE